MITLKVQLKDSLEYLFAIQPKDIEDLDKKDAVITANIKDTKVHLISWGGTREELLSHLQKEGGLINGRDSSTA